MIVSFTWNVNNLSPNGDKVMWRKGLTILFLQQTLFPGLKHLFTRMYVFPAMPTSDRPIQNLEFNVNVTVMRPSESLSNPRGIHSVRMTNVLLVASYTGTEINLLLLLFHFRSDIHAQETFRSSHRHAAMKCRVVLYCERTEQS
jgi:hypothetical protein